MREYASILYNAEYACIYRHIPEKQNAECASILNVSDTVHSIGSQYKLLGSYRDGKTYSEHCQTFKMESFTKRMMPECRCATRSFSGQGRGGGLWN